MADDAPGSETPDPGSDPSELTFHFIKGTDYRTIHVDGAWGGVSPRGRIVMSVYSERQPIPRKVVNQLKPDGTLGEEDREQRVAREGVIREVEMTLSMNRTVAKSIMDWLQEKVEQLDSVTSDGESA